MAFILCANGCGRPAREVGQKRDCPHCNKELCEECCDDRQKNACDRCYTERREPGENYCSDCLQGMREDAEALKRDG